MSPIAPPPPPPSSSPAAGGFGWCLLSAALGAAAGAAAAVVLSRTLRPSSTSTHAASTGATPTIAELDAAGGAGCAMSSPTALSDEVLTEQLTRNLQFFGADAQGRVARSFVVVVGLGGVGSHAAHFLLRSGVGKLRLIDFDQVTVSSLNRHAVATRADVGISKAACLAKHFQGICPETELDVRVEMYTAEAEESLLGGQPDFVLDAIDNIDTKVDLLAACQRRGIPVLCVGGAGARSDPTRIRIADISETSVDPLARSVRARLRKEHGITSGIEVVLSVEKPTCKLLPIEQAVGAGANPLDFQVVPNFRVRTIPVLGTLPAMFGMAAATSIICTLAGRPFEPDRPLQLTTKQYERQLSRLEEREYERFGTRGGVAVDLDEVTYLVRELWRGFSAKAPRVVLPGGDKGLCRSTVNLFLTRWDSSKPATVDNLVLLDREEADAHDDIKLEDLRASDPDFCRHVDQILQRARHDFCCRHDLCLLDPQEGALQAVVPCA
eukprot:jgi/Tetstr1/448669/TSEL_035911.t3